uniref:Putative myosin class ii heavy chain n=1 Tax=Xenopsylla cheopis TaxID=163159 RepID=A0A6M2DFQ7_XENCH
MMDRQLVWARDAQHGFVLGRISEILAQGVEIIPTDNKLQKRVVPFEDTYPAQEKQDDVDDNCELMFLNEATLLQNIKQRYNKDKIYTYVANILIAVNPYKEIKNLYSSETIRSYQGKSLGKMPPHVFAIGDKAFRDMQVLKQSQSIIVSGESGAGKTESTKYLLRYLCDLWAKSAGPIEQKILDANPILEAFGNAKTTRNNNSSRFGKFIEVHFDAKCQVVGGHISHYLLEKSRICVQSPEERNYHVFYMLCAGAPKELRQKLKLGKPDDYRYLKEGCTQYFTTPATEKYLSSDQKSKTMIASGGLRDPLLDDVKDFQLLDQALKRIGLSDAECFEIYSLVAAVLHLGNVGFEETPEDTRGGCRVATSSESSLAMASALIGVDAFEMRQALVSRVMQSSRGGIKGTVIMVPLKINEASSARDALAKALYSYLFDHIVNRINQSIPFKASCYYIGVLDIAGFEYFTVNSFEQFCINYCNEKLQQFFNDRILKSEQVLYKKEGLNIPEIKFTDNQDCIDLIEFKSGGLFNLLDEESKLPKSSAEHFTESVFARWPSHFRLCKPRTSRLKAHRELRDDEGFLIRHFAGAVCYSTKQFIEKNNDALHGSLEGLVQECSNPLLKRIFRTSNATTKGKLTFISVGSKFKTQLGELMDKLNSNGTNFIRCIKPNNKMNDHEFVGSLILTQLKCSGMTSVLELMEHGYPSRCHFEDLYKMYETYLPPELKKLHPKIFCEAMLHSLNLYDKDYKFGITRVFFRPGKFAEFDRIMKSDSSNLQEVIKKVQKWLVRSRWLKAIFCAYATIKMKNLINYRAKCLVLVQKTVRGHLVRKQHQPRLKGIRKINGLHSRLSEMKKVISQLKKDKQSREDDVKKLQNSIDTAIKTIKGDAKIKPAVVDEIYNKLKATVDQVMALLQKQMAEQRNAEEQERLRKIQMEIEAENRRKEEELRKQKQEEENRKKKAEIEAKRKQEEIERKKQEAADRKAAEDLQAMLKKEAVEDRKYNEQLEQERRDHELAVRLAQESNGQVDDSPPLARRSEQVRAQQAMQAKQKYDLSKWKYSELRDTINTSCDIELLEACKHEFHRRLKVYHAWKAKNRKRTTMEENERAPRSIMDAAKTPPKVYKSQENGIANGITTHRYFRIPFMRPALIKNGLSDGKRGWWYAHFDGQYVARQMEIHPEKTPILLSAGTDDMQMCELSLEETGLTRKRGAEILEHEFNREWERNGGKPYQSPASRLK